jgi:hypothetical protein
MLSSPEDQTDSGTALKGVFFVRIEFVMPGVLTADQLKRALPARQLLLMRSSLSIPEALEQIGGIQNQYAPNGYMRLLSCLENPLSKVTWDSLRAVPSVLNGDSPPAGRP